MKSLRCARGTKFHNIPISILHLDTGCVPIESVNFKVEIEFLARILVHQHLYYYLLVAR